MSKKATAPLVDDCDEPRRPSPRLPDATALAWELSDIARTCLTARERNTFHVAVGSGESYAAIAMLVTALDRRHVRVPQAMPPALGRWLDGYVGAPDEPQMREVISRLQTMPPESNGSRSRAGNLGIDRRYRTRRAAAR